MQHPPFHGLFYILNIASSIVLELVTDDSNIIVVLSPCISTLEFWKSTIYVDLKIGCPASFGKNMQLNR